MSECKTCTKCKRPLPLEAFHKSQLHKSAWCKECLHADYVAHRTQRLANGIRQDERQRGQWITVPCQQCGADVRQRERANRLRKFCSYACGDRNRKEAVTVALHAGKPARWCSWCGRELERTKRSDAYYCDERCLNAAHGLMLNIRRRGGIRTPAGSRISRANLLATSGGVCGICGGAVDPELVWPEPMSASVDHIVPIARGGSVGDPANMQIAHLTCNVKKRAREGWVPA